MYTLDVWKYAMAIKYIFNLYLSRSTSGICVYHTTYWSSFHFAKILPSMYVWRNKLSEFIQGLGVKKTMHCKEYNLFVIYFQFGVFFLKEWIYKKWPCYVHRVKLVYRVIMLVVSLADNLKGQNSNNKWKQ